MRLAAPEGSLRGSFERWTRKVLAPVANDLVMIVLDALRFVLALALLVALPGWLLAVALFPRREDLGFAQRVYLAIGGGILVTMLVASGLGFLPHGDRGALQSIFTGGMPNLELAMLAACIGLFWIGAQRGGYPAFASRHPKLVAPWADAAGKRL